MIAQEQPKQQILDDLVAEWGQEVIAAPYTITADPVPEGPVDETTVTIVDTGTNASTPDAGTGFSIVDTGTAPYVPPAGAAPTAPTSGGGGISPILWGLPLVMAVGVLVAFYSFRRRRVLAVNTRSTRRRNHRRKSKRSSRR